MLFRKLRDYNYLLDKSKNLVHDLLAIDSDNAFKTKVVPECDALIPKIKRRHKKYLTFNQFMILYSNGKVNGCPDCLVGFDKNKIK